VIASRTDRNGYPAHVEAGRVHPLGPGHRVLALTAFKGFYLIK